MNGSDLWLIRDETTLSFRFPSLPRGKVTEAGGFV
jgi:hypothetical protein